MTGPVVVKAATAAELLRHVPALAGVPVEDSLVLVLFAGRRSTGALRVDLPPSAAAAHLTRFATSVVGIACRADGVTALVPIAYTPEAFAATGRPPRAAASLLRAVGRRAEQAGMEVRDLLCVAADGWGSLRDGDLPAGGRPLEEVVPVEAPAASAAPTEPAPASPAQQHAFLRDLAAWWTRPDGPGGVLHGVDLSRRSDASGPSAGEPAMQRYRFGQDTEQLVELIERALDPHEAGSPCPCRALLHALAARPGLPGIVLAQLAAGRDVGQRIWAASSAGDPSSADLGLLVDVVRGDHRRPDRDRLRRAVEVLVETEGLAPVGRRAPVAAMLAWLHWACGAGTAALRLADRALQEDPEHEGALLVRHLVDGGRLPAWAFAEDPASDPWALPAA